MKKLCKIVLDFLQRTCLALNWPKLARCKVRWNAGLGSRSRSELEVFGSLEPEPEPEPLEKNQEPEPLVKKIRSRSR